MNGVRNGLRLPAPTVATRLRPEIVLPDLLESQGMSLELPLFCGGWRHCLAFCHHYISSVPSSRVKFLVSYDSNYLLLGVWLTSKRFHYSLQRTLDWEGFYLGCFLGKESSSLLD